MVIPAPCNHFSQAIFWKSMMQPFRVKLWKENQLWAKATHVNKLWCQAGKTSHVIYIQANDPFNGITITNSSTVKFPEGTWNPRMFGRSHTQRGHLNTPLGIVIAANNSEGSQKFGIYPPRLLILSIPVCQQEDPNIGQSDLSVNHFQPASFVVLQNLKIILPLRFAVILHFVHSLQRVFVVLVHSQHHPPIPGFCLVLLLI